MFYKSNLIIAEQKLPLGQCSTDILNFDNDFIQHIVNTRNRFITSFDAFTNPGVLKNIETVSMFQSHANEVLDIIVSIPPFKYFLPKYYGKNLFIDIFKTEPKTFEEQCNLTLMNADELFKDAHLLISTLDEIIMFKLYFDNMLDVFFKDLKERNSEFYALGFYNFLKDPKNVDELEKIFPNSKLFHFSQKQSVSIEYVPMNSPDNEKEYMIGERIEFTSLLSFLHLDFFKALINGHCPRRCHNCGTYFLLLSGHNTCYCSNLAPNQSGKNKNKTCRDVGAHNKERTQKENRTPARMEYDKVYNRLKARKHRKLISDDEWNTLVSKALNYKDENESGKLSDAEYKEIMSKF